MALRIKTKSVEDAPKVVKPKIPKSVPFKSEIDEIGALQATVDHLEAIIAEHFRGELKIIAEKKKLIEDLMKPLRAAVDKKFADEPATHETELVGEEYTLSVGKKGNQRKVKEIKALSDFLGAQTFMKIAKVDLKDIDKYLTADEQTTFIEHTHTARPISLSRNAAK